MIYFIQSETGHIKIGYSKNNVNGRLTSIQAGNPFKLKLLKTIDGDPQQESLIHNKFKKFRVRKSEWFNFDEKILEFISNPYFIPPSKPNQKRTPNKNNKLNEYFILKNIDKNHAAKELTITKAYLYEILGGRTVPGRVLAQRIVKWSNGDIRFDDLWGE